jgi:hypothetical protein
MTISARMTREHILNQMVFVLSVGCYIWRGFIVVIGEEVMDS